MATERPAWARQLAAQMTLEGVRQKDIAQHYGASKQYVSNVLAGRSKGEEAAKAYITDALNAIKAARAGK